MDLNQLTLLQKKLKEEEEAKMAMEPSMAFEAPSMPNPVPQPPSAPPPVEATTNLPAPTPLPSPPPEVAEPLPIAEADKKADEVIDSTAPDLPQAQRTAAKILAIRRISGEEVPPGVEETRQQLSQVADNQDAMEVVLKGRENAGKSRVESIGGLLSLALPVLIGAAVGGKRGALYGVQGAGTQMIKEMEKEEDARRELEKEERIYGRTQKDREEQQAAQMAKEWALFTAKEEYKANKEGEKKKSEKEDWFNNAPVEFRNSIVAKQAVIDRLSQMIPEWEELSKNSNRLGYQVGANLASWTPAYNARQKFSLYLPTIAKAFGDTGNIAVAEQKNIEKRILGNYTSSPGEVAKRLRGLVEELKGSQESMVETYKNATQSGGESLLKLKKKASSAGEAASAPSPEKSLKSLQAWKAKGASVELAKKKMEQLGISLPDSVYEEIWQN